MGLVRPTANTTSGPTSETSNFAKGLVGKTNHTVVFFLQAPPPVAHMCDHHTAVSTRHQLGHLWQLPEKSGLRIFKGK
eukprot:3954867-Pyramimonas_sp.AAC.1